MDEAAVDLFVGIDIGKATHHAVVLSRDGREVANQRLANREADLQAFLESVQAMGSTLVIVDQIAAMGTFPVAMITRLGLPLGYLPGGRMRQVAQTFPGEAKSDRRDAWIIAEAGRTMPRTIQEVLAPQVTTATTRMLCGQDDDLVKMETQITNRLRAVLAELHPALEAVVGPRLDRAGMLEVLERWPLPADLARVSRARLITAFRKQRARRPDGLVDEIRTALASQTIVVPGTDALAVVLPQLVAQLRQARQQRAEITRLLEEGLLGNPLCQLLMTMPGFGFRTAARTLVEIDGKEFEDADALAAYAGVAPVTRKSGTSIRSVKRRAGGNSALQNVWYQAAFASLRSRDTTSRDYSQRKRAEGKHHHHAVLCLARRRASVIFAMLRDGTTYHPQPPLTKT